MNLCTIVQSPFYIMLPFNNCTENQVKMLGVCS